MFIRFRILHDSRGVSPEYEIQSKQFKFSNLYNIKDTFYQNEYMALNLIEDTSYYFRIRAKIKRGQWSDWSEEVMIRTPKSKFFWFF